LSATRYLSYASSARAEKQNGGRAGNKRALSAADGVCIGRRVRRNEDATANLQYA